MQQGEERRKEGKRVRESRGGERERKRGRVVKGGISSEEYLFKAIVT